LTIAKETPDKPDLTPFYRKSWAVVIGINRYEKWPGLEYSVNDARSIEKKLRTLGFDEIITLIDHQATKQNIVQLLGDRLPRQVQKNDRLLIFFAGHGQTEEVRDRQEGYIIPVDGDIQNYYSTAISMTQVREFSKRIPAKHTYYVIDACYSGLGLTRSGPGISPAVEGYLNKITSLSAVQMITAGGKGEQVAESGGHGVFTDYFLKGLDGQADVDNDGVVTASELGAYLRPTVSKASGQKQTPQFGSLEGEGEFIFVLPKSASATNIAQIDTDVEKQPEESQKREEELRRREEAIKQEEEMLRKEKDEALKQKAAQTQKKEEDLKRQEEAVGIRAKPKGQLQEPVNVSVNVSLLEGAQVGSLRFFEGVDEPPPVGKRKYRESFTRSTADFRKLVFWELYLIHPAQDHPVDFQIKAVWSCPDDRFQDTVQAHVDAEWYGSSHWGRGFRPGFTAAKNLCDVTLYIGDDKIAKGSFSITYEVTSEGSARGGEIGVAAGGSAEGKP
jgi:uncharacterized caspase-like protein